MKTNETIQYRLVDTAGQITAVVISAINSKKYANVSRALMSENPNVEQVVFLTSNSIQTMGGELCINGSLAGVYIANNPITNISGINQPISFQKQQSQISIRLPKSILKRRINNIIQLTGIVYIISTNKKYTTKAYLIKLAKQFNSPASGVIIPNNNSIIPIVYVKKTDSLVRENACGSGSLAYALFSGISSILQPSGKRILINKYKECFVIKSSAKLL